MPGPVDLLHRRHARGSRQGGAAFAQIADRNEEAIAAGVIAARGVRRVHVTLASSPLRFAVVERGLGVRLIDPARWPRLDALARTVAARPSVTTTVPDDYAAVLCQRLVDRGSLLAATAAAQT